jgi:hypothetical protein
MVRAIEQRSSERNDVNWPVSVWNPKAVRFFNGKSVNVSSDGALISLPLKTPVCEGQDIEINFPRTEAIAKYKGSYARVKTARVVRIDRSSILNEAAIKVGLQFYANAEAYDPTQLELV